MNCVPRQGSSMTLLGAEPQSSPIFPFFFKMCECAVVGTSSLGTDMLFTVGEGIHAAARGREWLSQL